jgi:hypothetical protein
MVSHSRSLEGIEKRNEQKKNRTQYQRIVFPYTDTDRKRYKPPSREKYVKFPFISEELLNCVLLHFFKTIIPIELVTTLETSTTTLIESFSIPSDTTVRGKQNCYYFGHWRESSPKITQCPHTQNPAFEPWFKANSPLFVYLSSVLKKHYPSLYKEYEKVKQQYRLFGCWSMAILNIDSPSEFHTDLKDWRNGFCVVVTFGDYTGGELHFPLLNVTVNIEKGDVLFFQSHKLEYGNREVTTGARNSLVLVSHNNLFNLLK